MTSPSEAVGPASEADAADAVVQSLLQGDAAPLAHGLGNVLLPMHAAMEWMLDGKLTPAQAAGRVFQGIARLAELRDAIGKAPL